MKRILAIILVMVLSLSLVGCLSNEEKAEVNKLEKEATTYMKNYLKENYPGFKITDVEQIVNGNLLEGYDIETITEFTVKDNWTTYKFYYNSVNDEVYSTVNYDKVVSELEDMLEDNDFLDNAESGETKIYIEYNTFRSENNKFEAILDEHNSLKDVIKYIKKNDSLLYFFQSTFYYDEVKNIKPEDLEIDIDVYSKLKNYELHIYNVTPDYSKIDPYSCHIIDAIRFNDYMYFSDKERTLSITHTHHKIEEIDDLLYTYDDRYADFDIVETKSYKKNEMFEYNSTYKPVNRGYEIEFLMKNQDEVEHGDVVREFRNDNQLLVSIRDEDVHKATVFFDSEDYKDHIVYRHNDDRIDQFFAFDDFEDVYFYCHDGYFTETISLMKKVVEE